MLKRSSWPGDALYPDALGMSHAMDALMSLVARLHNEGKLGLYVGGEWRQSAAGGTMAVLNPATEDVIAEVATGTAADGLAAVDAATEAAEEWAATPPRMKSEVLRRGFDLMLDNLEALAALITAENGKSLADARGEVRYAAGFFRWFSEEAVRKYGRIYEAPAGDKRVLVLHQPVGVSLLVTPEISTFDGHPQDRRCSRRRVHLHPEAGVRYTSGRTRTCRPAHRGGGTAGSRQRSARPWLVRLRWGGAQRSSGPQAVIYRLDRGGQALVGDGSATGVEDVDGVGRQSTKQLEARLMAWSVLLWTTPD